MTFRVGMKVVCVNDKPRPGRVWMNGEKPTVGRVYEIIGFDRDMVDGTLCIVTDAFPNWGFCHWRFRPVVERKTDISIFTAMLNPSKVDA